MLENHKSAGLIVSFQTPSRAKQLLELPTDGRLHIPVPPPDARLPGSKRSRAQQTAWCLLLVAL